MATQRGPRIVRDGLVLCLDAADRKSYSGSGTSWNDLSSNNNTGTLTNGPTYSNTNGGSIVFDGTNDYVSITNGSTFSAQNFTLSTWIKFNAFNSYNCIITKPQNGPPWSNPYLSWMLRINSNNVFEFSLGSTTTYTSSPYTYPFSTGTIYNLVGTYDGSTMVSYINGLSVKSTSVSATINYSANNVFIGAGYGSSPLGEYINGSVYSALYYNKALSQAEITQNFNTQRGRFGI